MPVTATRARSCAGKACTRATSSSRQHARDCGALAGLGPKERPSKNNPLAAELARTKRRAERAEAELAKNETGGGDPGKSIGALGAAAHRERRGEQAAAVIDQAFFEVKSLAGTRAACVATGRSRATHYRAFQPRKLGPPRPRPTPAHALSASEQQGVLEGVPGPLRRLRTGTGVGHLVGRGDLLGLAVDHVPPLAGQRRGL